MRTLVPKVVVYCVRRGRLLVFRHADHPVEEVGLQVPGGGIRDGEDMRAAALRELEEETGRRGFAITAYLGTSLYDLSPHRDEVQERHFFLAEPPPSIDERWTGAETHDGEVPATRLEFFWIPLAHGHVLQSGQGALLGMAAAPADNRPRGEDLVPTPRVDSASSEQTPIRPFGGRDLIPDEATALQVGMAILTAHFGKDMIAQYEPYRAVLQLGMWAVMGDAPAHKEARREMERLGPDYFVLVRGGGAPEMTLSPSDGRVESIARGR